MRKSKQIELMDGDTPLQFEITQMSATQQYYWVLRAGLLIAASAGEAGIGVDTQTDISMGWLTQTLKDKGLGIFKGISPEKVQPLLDDLLSCCARIVGSIKEPCTPTSVDGYISNFTTLVRLQAAAFSVNFGDFFTHQSGGEQEKPSPRKSSGKTTLKIPHA